VAKTGALKGSGVEELLRRIDEEIASSDKMLADAGRKRKAARKAKLERTRKKKGK
jgi:hypothetical protein